MRVQRGRDIDSAYAAAVVGDQVSRGGTAIGEGSAAQPLAVDVVATGCALVPILPILADGRKVIPMLARQPRHRACFQRRVQCSADKDHVGCDDTADAIRRRRDLDRKVPMRKCTNHRHRRRGFHLVQHEPRLCCERSSQLPRKAVRPARTHVARQSWRRRAIVSPVSA